MKPLISAALLLTILVLAGCQDSGGPNSSGAIRFDPPNTEFATTLGITPPPPVTREQAMQIAEEAVRDRGETATALSVDQETEDGELLFEVQVQTSSGRLEVEVRASDGGVVEIETDDND